MSEAGDGRVVRGRGTEVPKLGFGTWQIDGPDCREAVRDALEIGYRHVDTARAYENEREVGGGLADSGVAREEVFLTTKVWQDDVEPRRLRRSLEDSLRDLGTDYVDLVLIHWPNPEVPLADSLGEMERLLELAREHDFVVGAYAPFGHGEVLDDPILREIGDELGRSPAQVALRWLIEQERVCALPKAASHGNRVANFEAYDFELRPQDRERIGALPKDRRLFDPDGLAPEWA